MKNHERRSAYIAVAVLALAFAWVEASVVVYLRELSMRELARQAVGYLPNLQVTFT
jgi:hypothetical protein